MLLYIDDCITCLVKLGVDPTIVRETVNIGPDEEVISINDPQPYVQMRLASIRDQFIFPKAGHKRLSMPLAHQTKHVSY